MSRCNSKSLISNVINNNIKPATTEKKNNGKKFPVSSNASVKEKFLKCHCGKRQPRDDASGCNDQERYHSSSL